MLLYPVKPVKVMKIGAQRVEDLTCQVALEAVHDLGLRQSLLRAPLNVGTRARATARPHDHRQVQGPVGGPIATAMQSMPLSPPARCRDRCHAAEMGKGGTPETA